jgi:hypothetical protein
VMRGLFTEGTSQQQLTSVQTKEDNKWALFRARRSSTKVAGSRQKKH